MSKANHTVEINQKNANEIVQFRRAGETPFTVGILFLKILMLNTTVLFLKYSDFMPSLKFTSKYISTIFLTY